MPPQRCPCLNAWKLTNMLPYRAERGLVHVINLRILRWGGYPGKQWGQAPDATKSKLLERKQHWWHLDFHSVRSTLVFWPLEHKMINLFKPLVTAATGNYTNILRINEKITFSLTVKGKYFYWKLRIIHYEIILLMCLRNIIFLSQSPQGTSINFSLNMIKESRWWYYF